MTDDPKILRRRFLHSLGASFIGALPVADSLICAVPQSASPPDFTLRIQPVTVELSPKHHVKTIGYNGASPGPILRVPEGKSISVDVFNETDSEDIVHWHGLHIPSNVDGSIEEARRRFRRTVACDTHLQQPPAVHVGTTRTSQHGET
jgi:FtsP/CotA-like multicopper oxidase with cupredoxin domain